MQLNPSEHPHRRYNPLLDEWIVVSPHRAKRPWMGKLEPPSPIDRPEYDESCYLCPGNERAGAERNPDYAGTYVFENDFSAVLPRTAQHVERTHPLMRIEPVTGRCRVICFSPRHDLSLAEMDESDIYRVGETWAAETEELGLNFPWVQVFENKGEVMGCSNPHPHGQIWATSAMPTLASREDAMQRAYFERNQRTMLQDYVQAELDLSLRVVLKNDDWAVIVPFWATWPFETLLLPIEPIQRLPDLAPSQRTSLSKILKGLLVRYDNLFQTSFPYSWGWHGAPYLSGLQSHWHLHAHFLPPLLRSASVKKFMVGFEMLSEAQRDITPEQAAQRLRELPGTHYRLS